MNGESEQLELSLSNTNKGSPSEGAEMPRAKGENSQGKYKNLQGFMSLSPISIVFMIQSAAISTGNSNSSLPSKPLQNLIIVRGATATFPSENW